jgi:hypothetical protein
MEHRAETLIEADPDRIWDVLADASSYPDWDSGVEKVEGRVGLGETIKVYSEVNPGRAFPVKVVEFERARRMVWKGGMPLGLFTGLRTFGLTPEPDSATRFTMHERFSGPLLPLIGRSMPDLGPSFEQFARGLKDRAEGGG